MKIESNKNWTTCLRLNTGDGSPRVFLLNSHFLGSVPSGRKVFGVEIRAGYLTSFGDERLEKFLSFFGVGEVEFGHFTKEFHAAVF